MPKKSSRFLIPFGVGGTLVAAALLSLVSPLGAAFAAAVPLGYLLKKKVIIPSWSSFRQEVSGAFKSSPEKPVNLSKVSDGDKTGNTLVDALVVKLRGNGIKVSTDWESAKKILASLPEKYDTLKRDDRHVHGFVYQGMIFLNPADTQLDVPIHEYTHLWAEALRQNNAEEWQHVVEMMKEDITLWNEVKANYPHLESDDEIADEVLATFSGRHGAARLAEHAKDGVSPEEAFKGVLGALERFWAFVGKFFGITFDTKEDLADRIFSDLLKGYNPEKDVDLNKISLSDRTPLASQGVTESKTVKDMNVKNDMTDMSRSTVTGPSGNNKKSCHPVTYSGQEARQVLIEILRSEQDDGKVLRYPRHLGAVGFFLDHDTVKTGPVYTAFDNSTGDCWVEDFHTSEVARQWIDGLLGTDEAHVKDDALHVYHADDIMLKVMPSNGDHITLARGVPLDGDSSNDYIDMVVNDISRGDDGMFVVSDGKRSVALSDLSPSIRQLIFGAVRQYFDYQQKVGKDVILTDYDHLGRWSLSNGLHSISLVKNDDLTDEFALVKVDGNIVRAVYISQEEHHALYNDKTNIQQVAEKYFSAAPQVLYKKLVTGELCSVPVPNSALEEKAVRSPQFMASVEAVVSRTTDPSARSFTDEQRGVLLEYLKDYGTVDRRLQALSLVWLSAAEHPKMSSVSDSWKTAAKEELNDLASGIVACRSSGLGR